MGTERSIVVARSSFIQNAVDILFLGKFVFTDNCALSNRLLTVDRTQIKKNHFSSAPENEWRNWAGRVFDFFKWTV